MFLFPVGVCWFGTPDGFYKGREILLIDKEFHKASILIGILLHPSDRFLEIAAGDIHVLLII